jgi:acetyl esterase/lipase
MDAGPGPMEALRAMLFDLLGGPDASIEHRRRQSAVFAQNQPAPPPGVRLSAGEVAGVPVERVEPAAGGSGHIFLHLHGGGYVMGDPAASRGFTTALVLATGAAVVSVDYRLGPDHPFPSAVDDALAVYRGLLDDGASATSLAIGGESAGGGLAIATLVAARDAHLPMPACGVALSPWADLACEGASHQVMAGRDPLLTREVLMEMAGEYLAGVDPRQPRASPICADLASLPPLLVQVGSEEVLLDDAVALAARARAAGVEVDLQVWPGMIHVWQMFGPLLPEAGEAVDDIARFLKRHWPTAT